jgi:antitoxin HicB
MRYTYPVTLTIDETDGGFVVTFPDLPEAVTQGETEVEALSAAADCIEEAIAARIDDGLEIPEPSEILGPTVPLPLEMALKASLFLAVREAGVSKSDLARRLDVNEKEARRMLDPHHHTRLVALERALRAFGKVVELSVV